MEMNAGTTPLSRLGSAAMADAARATRISMDSAERALGVQLEYARGALERASATARAAAQARDVQEFFALRTRMAETAIESLMGYSRSLYEVASEAQSEYARLAEERMARFQQVVTEGVDQAAKAAPGGGDVAVAAVKSQLAAATAAFDSFTKAARSLASYADAGVGAARPTARRK
jgi:phasin family protein